MSTKIYKGFVVETTELRHILKIVRLYREKHWKPDAAELKRNFKQKFINAVSSGAITDGDNPSWKAEKLWIDLRKEVKDKGIREPAVDTDFQIVIFPDKDRFLGVAYVDHHAWFDKFLRMPKVKEYGYWNNSDHPKEVTLREWQKRESAWDRVLLDSGTGIPAMEGFTIDISDPYGPFQVTDVVEVKK